MAKLKYGIVGHPVKHSLSPAMQSAAFKSCGVEAEYHLFDIEPAALEDFLEGLARRGISGLNVTIPHKIAAKGHIERNGILDVGAKRLGAVNTIKVEGGALEGYNTDGAGFYRSLVQDLHFEPEGKRVLVLGAGGASHAIVMYLGNGPKEIFVYDVDGEKARALKNSYKAYYDEKRLILIGKDGFKKALGEADLLVNATPVGMNPGDPSPVDKGLLHPSLRVYDLVYNQKATALVREATGRKLHAATGIGMLLYQGAIAFEIWTGRKAPIDVMRKALKERR